MWPRGRAGGRGSLPSQPPSAACRGTGAWTALVGVAMIQFSSFEPWLGWPGIAIGLTLVAGSLEFVGPFEETGWKLAGAIVPIACAVGPAHSRGCGTRHRLRHALSPASRRRPRGCLCGKRRGVGGDHQGRTKVARKHKTRPSAGASDRRNPAPLRGNPHGSTPSLRSW
jgi:hypothetical protein